MIHNLKDGGVAYRLATFDDPDDGYLAASIDVQRDGALYVDRVTMPAGVAVQLFAALLLDHLSDNPLCDSCELDDAVKVALTAWATGREFVCGEDPDDDPYLTPGDLKHLAKLSAHMDALAARRHEREQLALFVDDPETGKVVVNPAALA
jgi:hypothetical protein